MGASVVTRRVARWVLYTAAAYTIGVLGFIAGIYAAALLEYAFIDDEEDE